MRSASRHPTAAIPSTRRRTRRPEPHRLARALAGCGLLTLAVAPAMAQTAVAVLPGGLAVAAGQAQVATTGNRMTVTNSPSAILNWNSFSIGNGAAVHFQQQAATSQVLNRVTGADPSNILGSLSSNGRVWLLNPNGVLFGQSARVDVAGLVASTLRLNDADWLAGRWNFGLAPGATAAASVVNQGELRTPFGGSVALVGGSVDNQGLVATPGGQIVLAAGKSVELVDTGAPNLAVRISATAGEARNLGLLQAAGGRIDIHAASVNQQGIVSADTLTSGPGGEVWIKAAGPIGLAAGSRTTADGAAGGTVHVESDSGRTSVLGSVSAHGADGAGGQVALLGREIGLFDAAHVDASGRGGGGEIRVGGGERGADPAYANARAVYVGPEATLAADATAQGDGGRIVVWSDEATRAFGSFSVRGGPNGGNGGFIETSGGWLDARPARIDTAAPHGRAGSWLLDPYNITISDTASDSGYNSSFTATANSATIFSGRIEDALEAGTNVTVSTGGAGAGGQAGNITLTNANISVFSSSLGNLTLLADGNITMTDSRIVALQGPQVVTLLAGRGGSGGVALSNSRIDVSGESSEGSPVAGTRGIVIGGFASGQLPVDAGSFGGAAGAAGASGVALTNSQLYAGHAAGTVRIAGVSTGSSGSFDGVNLTNSQVSGHDVDIRGDSSTRVGVLLLGASIDAGRSIAVRGTGQGFGTQASGNSQLAIDPLAPADPANGMLIQGRTRDSSGQYGVVINAGSLTTLQTVGGAPITIEAGNSSGGSILALIPAASGALAIDTSAGGGLITLRSNGVFTSSFGNGPVWVFANIAAGAAGVDVDAAGQLSLSSSITSAGPVTLAGYAVDMAAGTSVASTASGDAIVIAGHNGDAGRQLQRFTLEDSSVALTTATGGRWIVYATSPAALDGNAESVLDYDFKQHGAAYGDWSAYSGNGFVFGDTATANYSGTVSTRAYNGQTSARVSSLSVASEHGDSGFVANEVLSATYADKNAGTNKTATLDDPTFNFYDANERPVYGYEVSGALIGTVTRAALTATVGTVNRVYDATTTAQVNVGTLSGLVGSETVAVTATGRFADKNVGTAKAVTPTYAIANGSNGGLAANYQFSNGQTLTASITPRSIAVSGVTANNKVYDRTTSATATGTATLATLAGDNLTLTGTAAYSFADRNAGTAKPVTVSGLQLAGSDAGNYTLAAGTLAASITPRPYAVGGLSALNKTYDATTTATLSGSATGAPIAGDQVTLSAAGSTSARFADKNVGTAKAVTVTGFTLSGADAANYAVVQPTGLSASITTRSVALIGITAAGKVYDGSTVATLAGTAAAATLAGDAVTLGGAGSGSFANKNVGTAKPVSVSGYLLQGADAGNYSLLLPTGLTANITPRPLALVNPVIADKVYDSTTAATFSGTPVLSVVAGDAVTLTGTATAARFADKNVGVDKPVTVSGLALAGADAANYTLSQPTGLVADITRRPVTLGGLTVADKVYDGSTVANFTGTPVLTVLPGDSLTLVGTATAARFDDKNVGTAKPVTVINLGITGADSGNYTLSQPIGLVASITPRAVTLSGLSAADKVYDGTTVATLSGSPVLSVLSGDTVTLTGTATAARFADRNAGIDKPVTVAGLGLAGLDAANYTLSQPAGLVADITPRPLALTLAAANKVYDGTTTATLSFSSATPPLTGDDVTFTGAGTARFADKNVGVGKPVSADRFGLAGIDAANYTLSQTTGLVADITPRPVTLAGVTAADKVYDGTTAATLSGTATLSVLTGDAVTLTGTATAARFADRNVGIDKPVTVAGLGLAGLDAANYTLSQPAGLVADITPRPVTLSGLSAADKVYDGTTVATLSGTATLSVLAGDTVTLTGTATAARFADKNVGNDKPVNVIGLGLVGADAANYTLSQPAGLVADITPRPVTLSGLSAADKVYDGTTAATLSGTAALSVLTGDTVTLTGAATAARFNDKNVGNDKPVTVAGLGLAGVDAANYTLSQPTGLVADITPRPVTLIGLSAADKVYDGTTAATLSGTAALSVLTGDTVTLTGAATAARFNDKNVGNDKPVTVAGLGLAGLDAANYTLSQPAGLVADITPRPVTLSGLSAGDKVYDGTTVATLSGSPALSVLSGDTVTLTGTATAARFVDKNVGTDKPVNVIGLGLVGADAANYTLSQPAGLVADITPRSVTLTGLTAADKVYDGTTVATLSGTASLSVLTGDTVTLTGTATAARFADKNAGNDKPVTVAGLGLAGTDAANYTLSQPTGLAASITPLAVTVTGVAAADKVYDAGTTASLTGTATVATLAGDAVLLAGAPVAAFADKNAGTAKPVGVSGYRLDGADAANYRVAQPNGLAATIAPRPFTQAGYAVADKVYDGTTAATIAGGSGSTSALPGDAVSLSGTASASFADPNAGNGKSVRIGGLSLAGADAPNYRFDGIVSAVGNITPATLQYVAVPTVRSVGAPLDGFAGSVTGFVGSESAATATSGTLSFDTPAAAGSPAGSYPLLGSGLAAANYRFVQASANASALSIVDAGPSVPEVVAAAQNAGIDALLPQRSLPLSTNSVAADSRVLVAIAPAAAPLASTATLAATAASFAPVALSSLSPGAIQQLLDNRSLYMRTVLAAATTKLEDDPQAADLKECETAAEAQQGTCLLTAKLKSRLAAAAAPTTETTSSTLPSQPQPPAAGGDAGAATATPVAPPTTTAGTSSSSAAGAPAAAASATGSTAAANALDDAALQRRRVRSAALPQIDRKIALVIGVDRYNDAAIPSLSNAVRDARAIGQVFEDKLGYEVVTVANPTRATVVASLNRLALTLGPRDSVVVYYAGHGDLVEATGLGYWLLADSNAQQPETWLSNADISRSIAQMGARQVALVSDSCYSGSLASEERIRASARSLDPKTVLDRKSVVVMSSGGNEPVFDEGKDGHSPFAWNLMNTLGQLSNWQAGGNVFERVRFAVARALPQRPQYSASRAAGHESGGDYLFEQRQLEGGTIR